MDDVFETIVDLRRRGEKAVLATVVGTRGSAPRKEGAKMVVRSDGRIVGTIGGGALEHRVCQEALKMMGGNESQLAHFELTNEDASREGQVCGGVVDVFIEPLLASPTLFVFGGGHISLPLARIAKLVDFRIVVIDDRPEFANAERFPEAAETISGDLAAAMERLAVNGSSYIVIVTRGHQHDAQALEWAAQTDAAYVGMIGSRKKIRTIFDYLLTRGVTQAQLDRVHSPIGLPIGGETPEEIAVSIVAELIQVRHQGQGGKPKITGGC
ncbi:MAG: XdhC/CoxI family protein [Deltaproteobacteria bacterium]|nr:XdhC/CoxI family protein [Deltaproteobacteria bacterium]